MRFCSSPSAFNCEQSQPLLKSFPPSNENKLMKTQWWKEEKNTCELRLHFPSYSWSFYSHASNHSDVLWKHLWCLKVSKQNTFRNVSRTTGIVKMPQKLGSGISLGQVANKISVLYLYELFLLMSATSSSGLWKPNNNMHISLFIVSLSNINLTNGN